MLSPSTYALSRQAPPVRPSRSLEGLEQVVPPGALSASRSRLYLDKPLPDLPTDDAASELPFMAGTTAWSDDSSTVHSFDDHDEDGEGYDERDRRHSSISTASYPVFVRSGSDDLADLVDHPSVSALNQAPSVDPYDKPGPSPLAYTSFLTEDRYSPPPPWAPTNRTGPNHYFREKKWDFFPELATPSALPPNSPHTFPPRPRKKDSMRSRWMSADKGAALANDVRNSIRSLVQRRLSRNSIDKEKPKRKNRPTTSPEYTRQHTPPQWIPPTTGDRPDYGSSTTTVPQSPIYFPEKFAHLSISPTGSSLSDESLRLQQPDLVPRKKQPAVAISPYQKYGAAIWDKSGKEKRISYRQSPRVRFPKYGKPTAKKKGLVTSSTPPLSPAGRTPFQQGTHQCVRALQDGTSHMLVVIDNTRKKIVGAKVDRRRSQLKSKIRLVGPVNPYTFYEKDDPWV
ncbi:hypothetical protein BJX63DRAFT_420557 [Aspergillus granulosus]|uniref:Uncharacterized protein n=1 Tax=Aspergillus granulosus TaxID=176169 RepID=A0ABR4HJN8_9EURO